MDAERSTSTGDVFAELTSDFESACGAIDC